MSGDAASKVAIVTGGSEGIGHAIALRLLADGYRVALLARQPEKLGEACEGLGPDARGFACDLGSLAEIERTVRAAAPFPAPARMGRVTYTDTWLWDRSGRFQLDTLTEGQN